MILSIQYFRGVAALMVLFAHLSRHLNDVYAKNDLGYVLFGQFYSGVDLFFIISGFVICLSTEKVENNETIKYIVRRVFRVYPLLIFCIAVYSFYLYALGNGVGLSAMLKAMIPVQADYNLRPPYFGYNLLPTAWTLSFELLFYSVFLVAMCISKKYRMLIAVGFITIQFYALQVFFNGSISFSAFTAINISDTPARPIFSILSSSMMFEFCIGIISYAIYKKINIKESEVARVILVLVFSISLIILCSGILQPLAYENKADLALHGPLKWGALFFFMFNSFVLYEKTFGVKKSSALMFLGEISYSIYLTQWVVFSYMLDIPFVEGMQGVSKFLLLNSCA
ncbi:hypothetical protein C8256_25175 [Kluyvera genomosp. 2]|uniref:Acyltransferase 3 domain-containing protein n=1 Tax=Kluyvera genomosp. 2 TaxID=2774054 RepID=A0A2T2XUZ7_9ENTR|nr:hypothetical protein C8256_25175 [Kluyvera genomosp. 2]